MRGTRGDASEQNSLASLWRTCTNEWIRNAPRERLRPYMDEQELLRRVEALLQLLDEQPDYPKLRRLAEDMRALADRLRSAEAFPARDEDPDHTHTERR